MVLSNPQRHNIAMETAEYWKHNCSDDKFYYNCRDTISDELEYNQGIPHNTDEFSKEYKIILNLIEEIYLKDNWKAIQFFDKKGVDGVVIVQYEDLIINNIVIKGVWSAELEYDTVVLYNAIEEEIGHIKFSEITDIKIGD